MAKGVELNLADDDDAMLNALCNEDYEGIGKAWLARAFFRYGMLHHQDAWKLAGERAATRKKRRNGEG